MATLTADEIEYIRIMSGDNCVGDYTVSETLLQKLFDRYGTECGAIVEVLRARVQKAAKKVNQSNESGQSVSASQEYAQLSQELARWSQDCGLSGGVLEMGTLDLRLDTDDTDEDDDAWQS